MLKGLGRISNYRTQLNFVVFFVWLPVAQGGMFYKYNVFGFFTDLVTNATVW